MGHRRWDDTSMRWYFEPHCVLLASVDPHLRPLRLIFPLWYCLLWRFGTPLCNQNNLSTMPCPMNLLFANPTFPPASHFLKWQKQDATRLSQILPDGCLPSMADISLHILPSGSLWLPPPLPHQRVDSLWTGLLADKLNTYHFLIYQLLLTMMHTTYLSLLHILMGTRTDLSFLYSGLG